jgi:hypothetical protein
MQRLALSAILAFGTLCLAPSVPTATACPMCKLANEEGSGAGTDCEEAAVQAARPRAYMYSILFMLSMPATLLTGFGIAFYRLHRQQQAHLADEAGIDAVTA